MNYFVGGKNYDYWHYIKSIYGNPDGKELLEFLKLPPIDYNTYYKGCKLSDYGYISAYGDQYYGSGANTITPFAYLILNADSYSATSCEYLKIWKQHIDLEKDIKLFKETGNLRKVSLLVSIHLYLIGLPQCAFHGFTDCFNYAIGSFNLLEVFLEHIPEEKKMEAVDYAFKRFQRLIDHMTQSDSEQRVLRRVIASFINCDCKIGIEWHIFTRFDADLANYLIKNACQEWIGEYTREFKVENVSRFIKFEKMMLECKSFQLNSDDHLMHHVIRSLDLDLIKCAIETFPEWKNKVNKHHVLPLQIPIALNDKKMISFLQEQGFESSKSSIEVLPNETLTHIISYVVNIAKPDLSHILHLKLVSIQFYEAVQSDIYWQTRFFYKYHKMVLTRENWVVMTYYKGITAKIINNTSLNPPVIYEKIQPLEWVTMSLRDLTTSISTDIHIEMGNKHVYLLDSKMKEMDPFVKGQKIKQLSHFSDQDEVTSPNWWQELEIVRNLTFKKYIVQLFTMTEEERVQNVTKHDNFFLNPNVNYPVRVWKHSYTGGVHLLIISRDLILFMDCKALKKL